jgi:hypothetical protein
METASDFRELARRCLLEAAETKDDARKQTLVSIAQLYNRTALEIEAAATASEQGAPSHIVR